MDASRILVVALAVMATVSAVSACGAAEPSASPEAGVTKERRHIPRPTRTRSTGGGCTESHALVTFSAGDGFTYANDVVVCPDGHAELEWSSHLAGPDLSLTRGHRSFVLTDEAMERLRAALETADLPSLADAYRPETQGADLPSYSVTQAGKTVYTDTFALNEGRVPERFAALLGTLNEIVEPEFEKALATARGSS